jgi:hypothetical protein
MATLQLQLFSRRERMGAVNVLAIVGNFVLSNCAISSDESILDTSSSRAISSSLPLGVIPIPPATDTSCSKGGDKI